MAHNIFWVLLTAVVISASLARADYEAARTLAQAAIAADPSPASLPSKEAVREAQELLAALGYAPGPADGVWGGRSARAYKAFLQEAGLPAAEVLTAEALQAIRDAAERRRKSGETTASTGASEGASQGAASPSTPTRSTGGLYAAMEKFVTQGVIQGLALYRLLKLIEEDPENAVHFARALQKRLKDAEPAISFKPKCAAKGTPDWTDVANKPNCRVWVDCYVPDQTVTWSGTCSGGHADGPGTLEVPEGEDAYTGTGTFSKGKRHGRWVLRTASGQVQEGIFVDGKRHGRWVVRFAKGILAEAEGPFVDGEMLGRWVLRHANGTSEGPLVDGKPHGRWVVEHRDGKVTETVYVDGRPGC